MLAGASEHWHRQAALAAVVFVLRVDEQITAGTNSVELAEVLEPIIDNAIRHTPTAGSVEVDARLGEGRGGALVVSVSNSGEPIAQALRPYLFDAWVSTRDASVAGGLGLWLVRETARDLGGDIELVDDAPNTTFRLRLPLTEA